MTMQANELLSSAHASMMGHSALGGSVSVDFDGSVLIQFVAFLLLFLLIKPLLLDPFLKLVEERERRTEGAKAQAREMDEKAGDILQRYEAQLEKVRKVAGEEREKLRHEAQKLEAQILQQAREQTSQVVDEGKARIAQEANQVRSELRQATPALARDIASRVLGREVL